MAKGVLKKLEGKMDWIKCHPDFPEEFDGKQTWSVTLHPTRESLDEVRDMQAEGIKNVVKKGTEPGDYYVKFSRKVAKINKAGKVTERFEAPKVYMPDGSLFDNKKMLGNGCEGYIEVDFYQGVTTKGKYQVATLDTVHLTKVNYYGETS